MPFSHRGQRGNRLVQRMCRVEVRDGMGGVGPEQVVVEVLGHPRGEQRLPGVLVAAGPGEALLVAVVDDGVAAREVHQLVPEHVPLNPFAVPGAGVVGHDHPAEPPHVVVAEEGRQLVHVGVGVGVPVVVGEERGQRVGRPACGRELPGRGLEGEVQHGLHAVGGGEVRGVALGGVEDLAEHEELALAVLLGELQDPWPELLPELVVDVLHRVDAETVDPEVGDPLLVDVGHPVDDPGVLGEQVVEPEEVAVLRVLAGEGGVTAVVVERDVVEPGRHLEVLLGGVEHRRVGKPRRAPGRSSHPRSPGRRRRRRRDV